MPVERLQKVLARAGIASRRKCEEMIAAGRVRVNGQTVCEPGTQIDAESDGVEVDGQPIAISTPRVYWLVNKPVGYLSAVSDPRGRPTVLDLMGSQERLYPVGRLDLDSEGLILLTNDGELAQRLTHPSFEHEKEYRVWVDGLPTQRSLQRLREGIELEDGSTWPAQVHVLREQEGGAWLRFVLHEGRKRQLRRMCEAVGHAVRRLIRVRMGPLSLGDLPMGESRALTQAELRALKKAVTL
jgi:pseudouridine synthase